MTDDRIVAVGLSTEENVRNLGATLKKVYPVDETPCFGDLIRALDRADCTPKPNSFTDWFGHRKRRRPSS